MNVISKIKTFSIYSVGNTFLRKDLSLHCDWKFSMEKRGEEKSEGEERIATISFVFWMITREITWKCLSLVWLRRQKKQKEIKRISFFHHILFLNLNP